MQKLARDRKPKPELCDRQFAAVPVRLAQDGSVQVLLITSRRTGRWLVPRGWPMRKLEP